jgi:hypothetical protein
MKHELHKSVPWRSVKSPVTDTPTAWGPKGRAVEMEPNRSSLLTGGLVDAVFDEVNQNVEETTSDQDRPGQLIESLNAQLTILQTQCDNLRRLLKAT